MIQTQNTNAEELTVLVILSPILLAWAKLGQIQQVTEINSTSDTTILRFSQYFHVLMSLMMINNRDFCCTISFILPT